MLHQLVLEEERKYTESLIDEVYQLLDILTRLQSTIQASTSSNQTGIQYLNIHSHESENAIQSVVVEMKKLVQSLLTRFQTELLELPSTEQPQTSSSNKTINTANTNKKKEVTQEVVFKAIQLFTKEMRSPLEPIRSLAVNRFDHLIQNAKTGRS